MNTSLSDNGAILFVILGLGFSVYASFVFNILLFILGLILLFIGLLSDG